MVNPALHVIIKELSKKYNCLFFNRPSYYKWRFGIHSTVHNFTQNPNLKEIWMGIKMMPIFANKKGGCHHTGLDV
jgi:hypothetical protein